MANHKKSFNFKNGVQVDVDNFVVNSIGNVGIGTSRPRRLLDVYGTARVNGLTTTTTLTVTDDAQFNSDVKIGTAVTISNGIVTATEYYGNGYYLDGIIGFTTDGFVVHTASGGAARSGIAAYDKSNSDALFKVGIGTTVANNSYDLVVGGDPNSTSGISLVKEGNLKASGTITADGGFIGTVRASDLRGLIEDARLPNTITSNIIGNLTGNSSSATVADGLQNTPDINVGLLTATNIVGTSLSVGLITSTSSLHLTGIGSSIGIGTNSPTTDLQIRRSGNAVLEVVSDTNKAKIGLGNSLGIGNSSAEIRFHNKNLELYNYDTGNIDTIIHDGTGAGNTGNFRWINGQDTTELLTLTYDGNLGINKTDPEHKLHVGGISTFTGAAHFDGDVTIDGTLTAPTYSFPSIMSSNINVSSGVSTIASLQFSANIICTDSNGEIGINTDDPISAIDVREGTGLFQKIGVSTDTSLVCPVDFSNAGSPNNLTQSFMVVPRVADATARGNLTAIPGAICFQLDNGQFYGCTGFDVSDNPVWATLH
mgnify:FL=1